jgi:hypothetical protein
MYLFGHQWRVNNFLFHSNFPYFPTSSLFTLVMTNSYFHLACSSSQTPTLQIVIQASLLTPWRSDNHHRNSWSHNHYNHHNSSEVTSPRTQNRKKCFKERKKTLFGHYLSKRFKDKEIVASAVPNLAALPAVHPRREYFN